MVTPNTIVKLYSGIPCDPTYQNVLQWDTVEEQNEFFANQVPVATYTDFQFLDGSRELRIPRQMENCYHINYVAYQNHRYGNKWFYAFVEDMRYLSPESTALVLSQDIWASWQFDLTFNRSFVARECVSNDTIGANTLPEKVELGTYVATKTTVDKFSGLGLVMLTSEIPSEHHAGLIDAIPPQKYGGLPNPCYTYNFGLLADVNYGSVKAVIDAFAAEGKSDAIISFYIAASVGTQFPVATEVYKYTTGLAVRTPNYSARNNKLYTYPYCALAFHSLNDTQILRYELFADVPKAEVAVPFGADPAVACTPMDYEGMDYNVKYQVSVSGFPLLPWIADYYQNWLAQNKAGRTAKIASAGLSMIGAIATGNPLAIAGGAVNAVSVISNLVAEQERAKIVPDTLTGSANASDVNTANGRNGLYSECMCIRPEYAKVIDDYFSMYGYSVNRNKAIELHTRSNWNFIQTVGCNVIGNCPAPALNRIKDMFDNGVTLWHNGNFNYGTLANPII